MARNTTDSLVASSTQCLPCTHSGSCYAPALGIAAASPLPQQPSPLVATDLPPLQELVVGTSRMSPRILECGETGPFWFASLRLVCWCCGLYIKCPQLSHVSELCSPVRGAALGNGKTIGRWEPRWKKCFARVFIFWHRFLSQSLFWIPPTREQAPSYSCHHSLKPRGGL